MRPVATLVLLLALLVLRSAPAPAEEWGGIEPGVTTVDAVRSRYGAPTKETHAKVEGYDTLQWVYEGAQAPGGIQRMTIEYGLKSYLRWIGVALRTRLYGTCWGYHLHLRPGSSTSCAR